MTTQRVPADTLTFSFFPLKRSLNKPSVFGCQFGALISLFFYQLDEVILELLILLLGHLTNGGVVLLSARMSFVVIKAKVILKCFH